MNPSFESIQNFYEQPVIAAVLAAAGSYPHLNSELLADVACVALNRLPTRYIRHAVDLAFYMSDQERAGNERSITAAVQHAFEFVQARSAMRARC